MASFVSISSPALLSPTPHLSARSAFSKAQFKSGWAGRALKLPLNCSSKPNTDAEPEAESPSPPPLSSSPSLSASVSIYNWCAGLGGLGFLETGYLTYLKLTNSDAFCPVGGGTCSDVLNSDFATVFGVPLPLIGLIAYGFVTVLGVQLAANDLPFGMEKTNGRLILLGSTTSMAAASTYFLYILSTKFAGVSCSYCLMSALLSFSLFFITLKDFGLQEIKKELGLLICLGGLMVAALNTSYYTVRPISTSLADIDLQPFTTEITTDSSPFTLSLARHLHSIGAKMYGAFWCSHCLEQKQMFGREAAKLLDYVECFPQGYRKGTKIAKACSDAGIEGFPAWVIDGEVLSGEQELPELARVSGFKLDDFSQPN